MSIAKVAVEDLVTESDVEQKFLYPALTQDAPFGLGISAAHIQTKHNIRRFSIGKGASKKSYFPDYLVVIGGLPLLVVEAKAPKTN
jgi:hypothetical protein